MNMIFISYITYFDYIDIHSSSISQYQHRQSESCDSFSGYHQMKGTTPIGPQSVQASIRRKASQWDLPRQLGLLLPGPARKFDVARWPD